MIVLYLIKILHNSELHVRALNILTIFADLNFNIDSQPKGTRK